MALFRSDTDPENAEPHFGKVILRAPKTSHYDEWVRIRAESQASLQPFEPLWARDELTRSAYKRRVRRHDDERMRGFGYAFFVFEASTDKLVGGCNLNNVRRGVLQAGSIGYWCGVRQRRMGYILDAVKACLSYSFNELGLHRVEAACIPDNEASRNLLLKAGFQEEGMARKYLKINGIWQDHITFARLAEDQ